MVAEGRELPRVVVAAAVAAVVASSELPFDVAGGFHIGSLAAAVAADVVAFAVGT